MHHQTIAFVTHSGSPELTYDDALVTPQLKKLGYDVEASPWDDSSIDWGRFYAVIIRSTWNYYRRYRSFLNWVEDLQKHNIPILNAPELLQWNHHKNYLQQIEEAGFPVLDTIWLPKSGQEHASVDIEHAMKVKGWKQAVLKPTVSADAWLTEYFGPHEANEKRTLLNQIHGHSDAMLQQFYPQVLTRGEWSLTYFNGLYSHTIRKIPKDGDYRVQENHGGRYLNDAPKEKWIDIGHELMKILPQIPVYARLDGIIEEGRFLISELELIEPDLYMRYDNQSPKRFAEALAEVIEQ